LFSAANGVTPVEEKPGGQVLALMIWRAGFQFDIELLDLTEDGAQPEPYIQTLGFDAGVRYSPDGNWVVFCEDPGEQGKVYVSPSANPELRWQLNGRAMEVYQFSWAEGGNAILVRDQSRTLRFGLDFSASVPRITPAETLITEFSLRQAGGPSAAFMDDGRHAVVLLPEGSEGGLVTEDYEVVLITNALEELIPAP
jgi:hypothetical protein